MNRRKVRISPRVRAALIGTASAAAIGAGTLGAAIPASASVAAPTYGCYGHSCTGKSAINEGCSRDAITPRGESSHVADYYKVGPNQIIKQTVTISLRYSAGCRSAWATITSTRRPDGLKFWVYNRGTHSTESAYFFSPAEQTKMVGDLGTKSHACTFVLNANLKSHKVCTPYF